MVDLIVSEQFFYQMLVSQGVTSLVAMLTTPSDVADAVLSGIAKAKIDAGIASIKDAEKAESRVVSDGLLSDAVRCFHEAAGLLNQTKKRPLATPDRVLMEFGLCLGYKGLGQKTLFKKSVRGLEHEIEKFDLDARTALHEAGMNRRVVELSIVTVASAAIGPLVFPIAAGYKWADYLSSSEGERSLRKAVLRYYECSWFSATARNSHPVYRSWLVARSMDNFVRAAKRSATEDSMR